MATLTHYGQINTKTKMPSYSEDAEQLDLILC